MAATLLGFTGYVLPAEMPEPLPPQWDTSCALRSGFGYKDNVFLSHWNPIASPFLTAGGDLLALRAAETGPEMEFFATADAEQFLTDDAAHTEYSALARAKVTQDFGTWGGSSLALQYFGQDQVLDVSAEETNRQAIVVKGHTFSGRPGLEVKLPHSCWVAVDVDVIRQLLAPPLDDYWQGGPIAACGMAYGWDSELSLAYAPSWRFYDDDPALTATGESIPGTHRQRFQQDVRFKCRHIWDPEAHWRTTVTLGGRLNTENGGGFSDYVRWLAGLGVEYRAKEWVVSAEGRALQYFYQNQTTGSGGTGPLLRRTELVLSARIQRDLTTNLSVGASYDYEQAISNEPQEAYSVSIVSGSVEWEF